MSGWSAWRFASPLFFTLVVLLVPIVYATLVGASQGRVRFSALSLVRATRGGRHHLFRVLPLALRCLGVFFLVLALARPLQRFLFRISPPPRPQTRHFELSGD